MAYYLTYIEKEAMRIFAQNLKEINHPDFIGLLTHQGKNEDYFSCMLIMKASAKTKMHELLSLWNTYKYGMSHSTFGSYGGRHVASDVILEHTEYVDGDFCNKFYGEMRTININK